MRRGFILTAITTILFMLLIDTTLQYSKSSSAYSKRVSDMLVSEKVIYTFDDVVEDVTNITGLRIERDEENITFFDHLPNQTPVMNNLKLYSDFINQYYKTKELEISWLDSFGNPVDLSDLESQIVILPFNFQYTYEDWGKRTLEITCPDANCSELERVELTYKFANVTFDSDPTNCTTFSRNKDCNPDYYGPGCSPAACTPSPPGWGTGSDFDWTPSNLACDPASDPLCIYFSLNITDNISRSHACPGPFCCPDGSSAGGCGLFTFVADKKSTMTIHSNPCWFSLTLGGSLPGDPNTYHIEIEITQSGGSGSCSADVDTSMKFSFNTTQYDLSFPNRLQVRDINYNASKTGSLNIFTAKQVE
jgi:hypothetical protein